MSEPPAGRAACVSPMRDLSAPIFAFREGQPLGVNDGYLRADRSEGLLALTGPSVTAEPGHLPVRGDLAHIRLAGRYFVPHYAVPMPRRVTESGAQLRKAGKAEAEVLCELPAGSPFAVLDIAGGWAWGQHGEDGLVGYVALAQLAGEA